MKKKLSFKDYEKMAYNDDMKEFDCIDCGMNTHYQNEYYMVHDEIWNSFNIENGMLCIGCLEDRLGRHLTSKDFTEAPINKGVFPMSIRLKNRINDWGFVNA